MLCLWSCASKISTVFLEREKHKLQSEWVWRWPREILETERDCYVSDRAGGSTRVNGFGSRAGCVFSAARTTSKPLLPSGCCCVWSGGLLAADLRWIKLYARVPTAASVGSHSQSWPSICIMLLIILAPQIPLCKNLRVFRKCWQVSFILDDCIFKLDSVICKTLRAVVHVLTPIYTMNNHLGKQPCPIQSSKLLSCWRRLFLTQISVPISIWIMLHRRQGWSQWRLTGGVCPRLTDSFVKSLTTIT